MLHQLIRSESADALRAGELERARILFAIALRAELVEEEARLRRAVHGDAPPAHEGAQPILRPLLEVWQEFAPPERAANAKRLAARVFAFADATASEPFPSHSKPVPTDAAALLANTFFSRDAQRVHEEFAAGRGLLLPEMVGATTCDLVAALVQLLLGAPFAPRGFAADMLLALVGALRFATAKAQGDTASDAPTSSATDGTEAALSEASEAAVAAPLDWNAVAALSERDLRRALRDGLDDDFAYEADEDALRCWRRARAAHIAALLRALRNGRRGAGIGTGTRRVTLAWLPAMETMAGLRALLALPAVTLPIAAALLLYELRRPLFPVCTNALIELKACGWVPPHAGATAAFFHLNARLPRDAAQLRALYGCLCQQNAFRLTRQAVVGSGEKKDTPAEIAYRERRGAYALQLPVCLSSPALTDVSDGPAKTPSALPVEDQCGADESDDESVGGDLAAPNMLLVAPEADSLACDAPLLSLADYVCEALHHHELYPETGCTPLVLALRPMDRRTARVVAAALEDGSLPQQQRPGEGAGLRYVVDVPWNAEELRAAVELLGSDDTTGAASLETLMEPGGVAGLSLFGFGEQLESGAHLAAKCDRAGALGSLLERCGRDVLSTADRQGRTALHAACAAGATEAVRILLDHRADVTAADRTRRTPLALAAASGSSTCCKLLLDHSATLNPDVGTPPLEEAAAAGAHDVVTLLLQHGAVLNAQDAKTGRTALHAAARNGHLAVARFLLEERGASLDLPDRTDRCAHEVLPDSLRSEASWLVDAGKAAAKSRPVNASSPVPRGSTLMEALTME